jgi:hypothetical protein
MQPTLCKNTQKPISVLHAVRYELVKLILVCRHINLLFQTCVIIQFFSHLISAFVALKSYAFNAFKKTKVSIYLLILPTSITRQ